MAPPVHNVKHNIREHSKGRGESCILKEILYAEFLLKSIVNLGTGLELLFVFWVFSIFFFLSSEFFPGSFLFLQHLRRCSWLIHAETKMQIVQ